MDICHIQKARQARESMRRNTTKPEMTTDESMAMLVRVMRRAVAPVRGFWDE